MNTTERTIHEGEIEVCAHRVSYWFDTQGREVTLELEQQLEDHAEERAKALIIEGNVSGELLFFYDDDAIGDFRGWWDIVRD